MRPLLSSSCHFVLPLLCFQPKYSQFRLEPYVYILFAALKGFLLPCESECGRRQEGAVKGQPEGSAAGPSKEDKNAE